MKCFIIQWRKNESEPWGPPGYQIRRFINREQAEAAMQSMMTRTFARGLVYEFRVHQL